MTTPSRVRLYVIDPRKFQPPPPPRFLLPKTFSVDVPPVPLKNSQKSQDPKRKKRKKRDLSPEFKTESRTRVGRISKGTRQQETISPSLALESKPKRKPPQMFKCQVCLKVYLGHTKLGIHFENNPGHRVSSEIRSNEDSEKAQEPKTEKADKREIETPFSSFRSTTFVSIPELPPPAPTPPVESVVKGIWDFVEERMSQHGIGQILQEISDVADRLGKLARDKFIPIREEEERLYASSPIIQVDNPFLSHLLDLPFGTYVFREEVGSRHLPPPPSAAELSLTGEVDVDKFVSPDILSLPHLTNIDFAAIL